MSRTFRWLISAREWEGLCAVSAVAGRSTGGTEESAETDFLGASAD